MKIFLILLLLVPNLSWGFFGKKYNCEPLDDEFFYMSDYIESLSSHILKIKEIGYLVASGGLEPPRE